MKRLLAVALSVVIAGCGAAGVPARTVSLQMAGAPADARVTIDDQMVGTLDVVAAHGVALPPGTHRISVEAPGYFPFDQLVVAKEGERLVRVQVKLVPIPD